MKKVILMAAIMLSSVATFAQNQVGKFTIQPKAGFNVANFTGDDIDVNERCGFVGGVEAEYGITDIFGVSGGVLYSQQGGKRNGVTMKLDYINIPILANVYVLPGLDVKLGVQPGFKVNNKITGYGQEVKPDARTFDFTIPVGLSYEFHHVVLDARYNWGLTKTYKHVDAKNSVFQFTLGYKFAL